MIDPALLPRNAVLANFTDEDAANLAQCLFDKRFEQDEVLITEGNDGHCLGLILSGKVELYKETEFPDKHVVIGIMHKGSVVGEACLFGGESCVLTGVAMEPCHIAFMGKEGLDKLAGLSPLTLRRLEEGILMALSRRLNQAYERIASVF